jgi:hypothetical protein
VSGTVAPTHLTAIPHNPIDNLVITVNNGFITLRSDCSVGSAHPSNTRVAGTAALGITPSNDSALLQPSEPDGEHRQRRRTPAQNQCAGRHPGRRMHSSTPIGACEPAKEDS